MSSHKRRLGLWDVGVEYDKSVSLVVRGGLLEKGMILGK